MAEAYRNAKSYNDKGTVRLLAESGDQKIDQKYDFSVALQRPNKLRLEAYLAKMVIDGQKLYASIDDLPGQVLEKNAPETLTVKSVYCEPNLTAALSGGWPGAGPVPQLFWLLNDKGIDDILRNTEGEPKLVEPGEIAGRQCYRVQIRRIDGLAIMWIDKETMVLRRMILPTDELRRQLAQDSGSPVETLSLVAEFPGAQLNGPVDPQAFKFEVPAGAEIVKFFIPPHPANCWPKKFPTLSLSISAASRLLPNLWPEKSWCWTFGQLGVVPARRVCPTCKKFMKNIRIMTR